ncbi:Methyl-coenzyme M reductase II subunit gamma [Hirschfeldia incana]|nr:Methyl-coenzyme M reductase II subunit gamma [Hirschfeldia incana]
MKMLLAEEMSKEMELNLGSTNLVAKLMGLDSFPQTQPDPIVRRSNSSKPRLKRSLSHGECRDVYEIWEKPPVEGLSKKKKIDIVREKFLEAKRLVTDDKLRHSKEFQEAMEVLSSNKELFLEFLQESNSFFSHHHLQSSTAPPTPEKSSKRITILKPSKSIESPVEKGIHLFKWPGEEGYPTKKTTRIVVLKPNGHVAKAASCPTSPRGCLPVDDFEEIKDVSRRVKRQILKEDTSHSSVFSNGYIGDDSYYADSEIISPVSRHSWEYMNKYDSPFSYSPVSRASGSPESSSVCREAKKRLSERWALMAASNENVQEEAQVVQKKGGNISLGEMLALSDSMTDLRSEEEEEANDCNEGHDVRVYASRREDGNLKPFNTLMRSKSLPESSTSFGHRAIDTTNKCKSKVPEELTKSKSLKWFLKGKVSKFLFSRNKKASKETSSEEPPECDASVSARSMVSQEAGLSVARSTTFGNSSEWRDEPSPVSVLQTSFDEDDGMSFNSSVLNRSSSSSLEPEMMMSMRSNLLGKSPSIGRSFSFDDSTVSRCYSSKRSTVSTKDEEEDLLLLINRLLSAAGLDEVSESISSSSLLDNVLSKWHSVESPLDPSLRESYANSAEHQRLGSNVKKLVFDLVNTLLLELTPSYLGPHSPKILSGKTMGAYVINRMEECLKGKGRVEDRWWDEDGDLSSLAVNRVVRMEVAEIGSPETLRLEMDSMGEELELKLLEELVEGVLMDFSERSKFLIPSIC